jgi:hypothetical protein
MKNVETNCVRDRVLILVFWVVAPYSRVCEYQSLAVTLKTEVVYMTESEQCAPRVHCTEGAE